MAVSQQSATKAQEVRALLDQAHAFIAQGSVMEAFEVGYSCQSFLYHTFSFRTPRQHTTLTYY